MKWKKKIRELENICDFENPKHINKPTQGMDAVAVALIQSDVNSLLPGIGGDFVDYR